MTKRLVAAVAGAALLALPVAHAAPAGPVQEESGTVIAPTPHPQDPAACFQGVVRRISMASQGLYTGPVFGAIFDIDPKAWGGKFKLTRTAGQAGDEDLDIFFFATFGDITQDPAMNSPVILAEYRERNTDGEVGVIPPNATKAAVCLWSGVKADWEFSADAAKKGKKNKK